MDWKWNGENKKGGYYPPFYNTYRRHTSFPRILGGNLSMDAR